MAPPRTTPTTPEPGAASTEPTKDELLDEARDLDVAGRSQMTKDELAAAVATAETVSAEDAARAARDAVAQAAAGPPIMGVVDYEAQAQEIARISAERNAAAGIVEPPAPEPV